MALKSWSVKMPHSFRTGEEHVSDSVIVHDLQGGSGGQVVLESPKFQNRGRRTVAEADSWKTDFPVESMTSREACRMPGSKHLFSQRDTDVYTGVDCWASSGPFTASVVYARFCSGYIPNFSFLSLVNTHFQRDFEVLIGKHSNTRLVRKKRRKMFVFLQRYTVGPPPRDLRKIRIQLVFVRHTRVLGTQQESLYFRIQIGARFLYSVIIVGVFLQCFGIHALWRTHRPF